MQKYLLPVLPLLLLGFSLQAQPVFPKEATPKKFELKISGGISFSLAGTQLKNHLSKNRFNYQSSTQVFGLNGKTTYPKKEIVPFSAQLFCHYRFSEKKFIGIGIGVDPKISVTGFRRTGQFSTIFIKGTSGQGVILDHQSRFISPFIGLFTKDKRGKFFAGPSFQRHISSTNWQTIRQETQKSWKVGALAGTDLWISKRFDWFFLFHWMPGITYPESYRNPDSTNVQENMFLSSKKIGFSHLTTGMTFHLSL